MLIPVFINGVLYFLQEEITILEACRIVGVEIPRFCYHEHLSIAGNCRMCLVELSEVSKPVISCSTDIFENITIYTESPSILKARENVLEFLLLNHPLDCPICDQAGECDLQDQSIFFGNSAGRNYFSKRGVEDKVVNHLIKTIMVRCIHCTKCVRFGEEICGVKFFGTLNRGVKTEIGNFLIKLSLSEVSANVVDLCPVGALTLKTLPYQIRPWEIQTIESIDLSDSLGSNIYLIYRGLDLFRVVPKKKNFLNDSWVSNKGRFYFELMVKSITPSNFGSYIKDLRGLKLFLANPDLDLKTLSFLKVQSQKYASVSVRLLNSTKETTNLFFWNTKQTLKGFSENIPYTFFLLTTNLQVEMPLLNIRLRSSLLQNSTAVFFGCSFDCNFPVFFARFSIREIAFLISGSFFFSTLFFKTESIIFANKALCNRLDSVVLQVFLKKKIKYYAISMFCNSEGANALNIITYNFKSFFFKSVFGLGLDDTYLLRKFIANFFKFFWVNQFSSNLLSFLPVNSWIRVEINQLPGFYVSLEQRTQQFNLLQSTHKYSIFTFIIYIISQLNLIKGKNSLTFVKFYFANYFFYLSDIIEVSVHSSLFYKKPVFIFSKLFIQIPIYIFFKLYPLKLNIEDPYRTSLQAKYSKALVKSSQLSRFEDTF